MSLNLKFSPANAKTQALELIEELQKYLARQPKLFPKGRKVYSLDLLSGHYCPYAQDCLAKAVVENGRRHIEDGPLAHFRCFSASQEVVYTNVYNARKHNSDILRKAARRYGRLELSQKIEECLPRNLGILRIHVAGDFFSQVYFDALALVALRNPDKLFYAYTKSLPYWQNRLNQLPHNFVLTASRGGRCDNLIEQCGFREAVVVYSEREAEQLGLVIDHDDSHAACPSLRNQNFALLIHGPQQAGTLASQAWAKLRKENGGYSRKKEKV